MLWRVPPETLERLLLPLGELTKPEVRERARQAGLPPAAEAESQEVCFAPDDYRGFLAERGAEPRRGEIVDRDGHVLGHHDGSWRFTVGQRRGLGLTSPAPLYVLGVEPESNRVVVGAVEELAATHVAVGELLDRGLGDGAGLEVQLRYRSRAVGVRRLRRLAADRAVVELSEPFPGPAPGQSAVFYRNDVVVGGGIITPPPASLPYDKVSPQSGGCIGFDGGDLK